MKSVLLVSILILTSIFFPKEEKVNYVVISGKIENPNSDKLSILDSRREIIHTFHLKPDNTFIDTLNISEGYYYFFLDKKPIPIYLKPSFNLKLSIDTKNTTKYVEYNGLGANENNYLIEHNVLKESSGMQNYYYGYYAKFDEHIFLKQTDSLFSLRHKFLKEQKNLDSDFIYLEEKALEYERLDRLSGYEMMHGFVTKNRSFKVSDNFPNPYEDIDLTDEKLSISPYYIGFLESYLKKVTRAKMNNNNSSDPILKALESIEENIKTLSLREVLAYNIGKDDLKRSKDIDVAFKKYNDLTEDKKRKEEVKQVYLSLRKIAKGEISPTFKLFDIDENLISLSDLKGKYIYIDIWATWCGPCKTEIPALKKLERHFKDTDIQFVSICYRDHKERWENMVKEKKLGGIQLFAPNKNISFFKDYQVTGIPHFILIDKDGRIIESNAKRPSNPKLKKQLQKLL